MTGVGAVVQVRSYTKKDGTRVSAHQRSAPGGGVVLVAAGVALVIALGPGTAPTAPVPRPATKAKVDARAKVTERAMTRLQRRGYQVTSRVRADRDCAAHSYGDVRTFFRDRPCSAMTRLLFEVRDRRRNVVLVAVAVVGMPDASGAAAYQRLVDRHGTGNVTELSRESGRYRRVRFVGVPYGSERDGEVVVNVQAQPVGRGPGAAVLAELVRTAGG